MLNKLYRDLQTPGIIKHLKPISRGKYPIYYYYADEHTKADTYIIYLIYEEELDLYEEDEAASDVYYIQVDVFSTRSPEALSKQIEFELINKGYNLNTRYNNFEKQTKLYHRALRFNYSKLREKENETWQNLL